MNVHSTNWVWANKKIFDELGIAEPTRWDELIAALDKIKGAGYTAVAHGGQPWQDATIFDAVVMATGGPEFYQKAMVDLDPEALGSDTMKTAFERMKLVLEPSGAASLAALLGGKVDVAGKTVLVIATGGNVSLADFISHMNDGRI